MRFDKLGTLNVPKHQTTPKVICHSQEEPAGTQEARCDASGEALLWACGLQCVSSRLSSHCREC